MSKQWVIVTMVALAGPGCFGPAGSPEHGDDKVSHLVLLSGWSVTYARSGDEKGTYRFWDDGSRSNRFPEVQASNYQAPSDQGTSTGRHFWANDLVIGHEDREGNLTAFYTPDRSRISSLQLLLLPHFLTRAEKIKDSIPPSTLSVDSSRGKFAVQSSGGWIAEYLFDDKPWPKQVVVYDNCTAECLFVNSTWTRMDAQDGAGPLFQISDFEPLAWRQIESVDFQTFPPMNPGGFAVGLQEAVEYARENNPTIGAYDITGIYTASFFGHNVTGASTWDIVVRGQQETGLAFRLDAPMGQLDLAARRAEISSVGERQLSELPVFTAARIQDSVLAKHPCGPEPGRTRTAGLSWSAEGILTWTVVGVAPLCEPRRTVLAYGANGWPLLFSETLDPF